MTILGMNQSRNADGEWITTLQVADDYNAYYSNAEEGRKCVGQKVDSIYVGTYDVSALKVGMNIEILYDKAISTKKGVFQSVKRIDMVAKN